MLVSILICTRNRPAELSRCLQSINAIDFESFEILVVNNGSTDFVPPQLPYRRPTYFFSDPKPGLSRARNLALPKAQGNVLALVDDDAVVDAAWLKEGTKHFEDPSIGCVTGRILPLVTGEWQRKLLSTGWFPDGTNARFFDRSNFHPLRDSPGTGSNVFLRKEALQKGFPNAFGPGTAVGAADEHFVFHQLIESGWRIVYEPAALVYHDFPDSEQRYRKVMFKYGVSRGALLSEFLLFQSGRRGDTFRYLMRKSRPLQPAYSARSYLIGLSLGPFALISSRLKTGLQRNDHDLKLVARFNEQPVHRASSAK